MSYLYELKNIEQFYDGKQVLNIKHLKLEENKIIGIFGPNGSGKSTLFSLLSFISKASKGEIIFNDISQKDIDFETKRSIIMLPQNPYLLKRTVYENIVYALKLRNIKDNLEEKVREALLLVGLDYSFSKRKYSELSGGEAQRVSLAARLILKPKVLLLDEPTSGVDTSSAQIIKEAILSVKDKYNTTILISSHDHNWLNHICDKKVALFQGKLVESTNVNLLFAPWSKDKDGNLVKVFCDGQKLTIPNTHERKRDSVMLINSNVIKIKAHDCKSTIKNKTLCAKICSIHEEDNNILVEFVIAGISFKASVSQKEVVEAKLLPGSKIEVFIDTKNANWL